MEPLEFSRTEYYCEDIFFLNNKVNFYGHFEASIVKALRKFLESFTLIKEYNITEDLFKSKICYSINIIFLESFTETEKFKTWKKMIPADNLGQEIIYNLNYDYFIKWSRDLCN